MLYAQYCRIENKAGGVCATPREFIRAALTFITAKARLREKRDSRHEWLRAGLAYLTDARNTYVAVVTGRCVVAPLVELYTAGGTRRGIADGHHFNDGGK